MSLRLTFMLCQQYVMSSSIVTTQPFISLKSYFLLLYLVR